MRLGRRNSSEDIVFSLEKVFPSSSSSEGAAQSSSSSSSSSSQGLSSSSSSSNCGNFNASATTVLGANGDIPDAFYASVVGIAIISPYESATLSYNNLNTSGIAFVMDIQIGELVVASLSVSVPYLGSSFSFEYGGVLYCGTFAAGTLNF